MKKMLLVILIALVSKAALATIYDIKCLNQKGKFSDCKVTIDSSQLVIEYKSKKEKEFNVKIPKGNIKVLSAGEYSRRRVAEAVIFSPWLLFSKKTRDHIGIEYVDKNNFWPKPEVDSAILKISDIRDQKSVDKFFGKEVIEKNFWQLLHICGYSL